MKVIVSQSQISENSVVDDVVCLQLAPSNITSSGLRCFGTTLTNVTQPLIILGFNNVSIDCEEFKHYFYANLARNRIINILYLSGFEGALEMAKCNTQYLYQL